MKYIYLKCLYMLYCKNINKNKLYLSRLFILYHKYLFIYFFLSSFVYSYKMLPFNNKYVYFI